MVTFAGNATNSSEIGRAVTEKAVEPGNLGQHQIARQEQFSSTRDDIPKIFLDSLPPSALRRPSHIGAPNALSGCMEIPSPPPTST